MNDHWPTKITVARDKKSVKIAYDDGQTFLLTAEMLRVLSPSAEVQGHSPDQKITVPGKRHVGIETLDMAGNYAFRIHFDDGHKTGIYTFSYLRKLGEEGSLLFAEYEAELARLGLER